MAMSNEQLMIELGLDATKVTKSISQLKTDLKSLEKQRALAKTEADLDIVNRKINIVEGQITKLKTIGFDNLEGSSKKARTAVTNLSVAIQDLPFGFIGIQNNLPGVIQGFGNLASESKGLSGFFNNLKGQLLGPGGIFLAFSIVTSVVTVLVQKYGSLGAAINALLGTQNKFNVQLEKFNKAYQDYIKNQRNATQITNEAIGSQSGQIEIIRAFSDASRDLSTSINSQNTALKLLQERTGPYHESLKTGKENVDKIREATEKYIKVLIAKSQIEAFASEISDIDKLIRANETLEKQAELNVGAAKTQEKANRELIPTISQFGGEASFLVNKLDKAKTKVSELAETSFDLRNKKQLLVEEIKNLSKSLIANTQFTETATKALKKYFEEYKAPQAYLDFVDFYSNENLLQRGTQAFNDLNRIDLTNGAQALLDFQEILKQLQDDFPIDFTGIEQPTLKTLPAAIKKVGEVLKRELDFVALDIVEADIIGKLIQQIKKDLEKATEKIKKSEGKIFIDIALDTSNVYGKGPGTFEQVMAPTLKRREEMKKEAQELVQNLRDTANLMGEVFFNPLQDQFKNLLETGKFSFKEFGRAVLDNMKQLAAKLLATGIVTLLATIATGGFSAATQAKTGLTGFQAFGKAFLGQLGFGPQRGPNLANIGAGGLAMSGAVNLTLRGSDLVGALNRTNTNINRIG